MDESLARVQRFITAFEERYGRRPEMADAEGDFKLRVATEMDMSVGGARYYLRLASLHKDAENKPADT